MQGLFSKATKAASMAANLAGNKAGEMIEVGKLKNRIKDQKQEAGMTLRQIGEIYYDLYAQGEVADPKVIELCEKVKACLDEINALEDQIQQAKDAYDAKNSMNNL